MAKRLENSVLRKKREKEEKREEERVESRRRKYPSLGGVGPVIIHLFNKPTFIGYLLHAWYRLSLWRLRCPVRLWNPPPPSSFPLPPPPPPSTALSSSKSYSSFRV